MKKIILLLAFLMTAFVCEYVSASDKPEIFVQTGHAGRVTSLAMDKSEKYLASIEEAGYLKIWEISSGKEIRTIKITHSSRNVYFADDEKLALVYEEYIEIYNIHGEKIEKIELPVKRYFKNAFLTKNRKFLYTKGIGGVEVHFYDIKDGAEIKIPEVQKYILNSLFDLGFGFFGGFYWERSESGIENRYVIYDENLKVITRGLTEKFIGIFVKTDPNLKIAYFNDRNNKEGASTFKLYGLDNGKLLCAINLRNSEKYRDWDFSVLPDGRVVVDYSKEGKMNSQDKKFTVVEFMDNCMYKEKSFSLNEVTSYIVGRTFLISGHANGNVRMLDINSGKEIKSFGVRPVVNNNNAYFAADKMLDISETWLASEKKHL